MTTTLSPRISVIYMRLFLLIMLAGMMVASCNDNGYVPSRSW